MTVSFKQFLEVSEAQSPEQLDEIWSKIFATKKSDDADPATMDPKAKAEAKKKQLIKDRLEAQKKKEEERKRELEKKRDDAWARAKANAEGKVRQPGRGADRDDYAFHRQRD